MPRDINAQLETGRTVEATVNGIPIDVEGGKFAIVTIEFGAFSGGSTTLDIKVQASIDLGVTYHEIASFAQLGPTNDDDIGDKPARRVVYVPRPETPGTMVKVRLRYVAAGSSPSYVITRAFLDPMLSMAPLAQDEQNEEGLALLYVVA